LHEIYNYVVDVMVKDLAVAANDVDTDNNVVGTHMFSLVVLGVVDDQVANDIADAMVVGLPAAANDDTVDDGGTDVDVTYAGARVESVTTSTAMNDTSLATISDARVVDKDTAILSGAIAMGAASDFAHDVTYEHQTITVPYFDMSQEVIDYMAEDGVQEDCSPVNVLN